MRRLLFFGFVCCTLVSIGQNNEPAVEEEDGLIKARIYSEVGLEVASTQYGLSMGPKYKIGANVYFLDHYLYGFGLNFNIVGLGLGFGSTASAYVTTPGIGPSLLVRTGLDNGLEFNLPVSYGAFSALENGQGIAFTPEVKWRKKEFSVGIAYNAIQSRKDFGGGFYDSFSLNFGFRFDPVRFFNFISNSGILFIF